MTSTNPKARDARTVIARFYKDAGKRFTLWSVTVICDHGTYSQYDVEKSKRFGYIFSQCGMGGGQVVEIDGPYFVSGVSAKIKEKRSRIVHSKDNPPWRSRETRRLRVLNRTRRLRTLPSGFEVPQGNDLIDWLERNGIQCEAVYCRTCADWYPEDDACRHVWWCDPKCDWSTPSYPCGHEDRDICRGLSTENISPAPSPLPAQEGV